MTDYPPLSARQVSTTLNITRVLFSRPQNRAHFSSVFEVVLMPRIFLINVQESLGGNQLQAVQTGTIPHTLGDKTIDKIRKKNGLYYQSKTGHFLSL